MSLRSAVFMVVFSAACVGGMAIPMIGITGYIVHYQVSPETQWWGAPLALMGIRFSLMLAVATAIGVLVNIRRLCISGSVMTRQEWLMVLFLALTWLSTATGLSVEPGAHTDPPGIKMTKVIIFTLMMTHIVTTIGRIEIVMWSVVIGVGWLGFQAHSADATMFTRDGRLDAIGGPDFREANGLGAYLAASMPFIGIMFLRAGWKGRMLCGGIAAMAINALVMTRSRGAMVGLTGGMIFTFLVAPGKHRVIMLLAVLAVAGGLFAFADAKFWSRAGTVVVGQEERDRSAESRLEIWQGAIDMIKAHPLGVGAGNFEHEIGRFAPGNPNRDAHNTFLRCCCELGIQGAFVLLLLIVNGLRMLRNTYRRSSFLSEAYRDRIAWVSIAITGALIILLLCGMTGSFVFMEALWWFLCLPVCLVRAEENLAVPFKPRSGLEKP